MIDAAEDLFRHPDEPAWARHFERRLYAYIDNVIDAAVTTIIAALPQPQPLGNPAASVSVTVRGGHPMPATITIDDTAGKASIAWADDHGDVAVAPAGVTVTLASDTPAVATLAVDSTDPSGDTYDITPVSVGTFSVVLSATDVSGAAASYPEGPSVGQPISAASDVVTVTAGPAASLVLSVTP